MSDPGRALCDTPGSSSSGYPHSQPPLESLHGMDTEHEELDQSLLNGLSRALFTPDSLPLFSEESGSPPLATSVAATVPGNSDRALQMARLASAGMTAHPPAKSLAPQSISSTMGPGFRTPGLSIAEGRRLIKPSGSVVASDGPRSSTKDKDLHNRKLTKLLIHT